MENQKNNPEAFDESQSLEVIKAMIGVSQKRLRNDGILFILWGWAGFLTYLFEYALQTIPHTYPITLVKRYATVILTIFAFGFTLVYLIRQNRKVTTYIGISLRYVWIYLFVSMVLINLIQANVLQSINFELQLPIFMVLISFAILVTGGILRYKMVVAGGIAFGLLAYLSSFFHLHQQLLIEAIAWLVAFIIPGHYLYANRNR